VVPKPPQDRGEKSSSTSLLFDRLVDDGHTQTHEERIQQLISAALPDPAQRLKLAGELARGGMGAVRLAFDSALQRRMAAKTMHASTYEHVMLVHGFLREAQVTGQLDHPNIVPIHELGRDAKGELYFTMKLVEGQSLKTLIGGDPIADVDRLFNLLEIFVKICDALGFAHSRGVLHCDIKSANVMVGEFGQVYLMDWGLAKLTRSKTLGADALMNVEGTVGTPEFMSPEQARGKPTDIDERTDVFGLGALLFEVLSGMGPYGLHEDANYILDLARAGRMISIDDACRPYAVSRRIRAVAQKATAADPNHRHQTVTALKEEMRAFLSGGLHLPRMQFGKGEVIVSEGERGDAAFMIVAGRCRAYRTADGREETLAIMEPGEAFGEMALLLKEPRAASVVAVDDVTVLVLDGATLNEGLGLSGWTGALVRALAQRFADLEKLVRSSGLRRSVQPPQS